MTAVAQAIPVFCAMGFWSRNCAPKFLCPPDWLLSDPTPVGAAILDVVDVKVGFTKAVASLSQLKQAVCSGKLVSVRVTDVPKSTPDTRVANIAGTDNEALAYRPMSRFTDGAMFVSSGKTCERNPVTGLEEFNDSQSALTLLTEAMVTERAGRSINAPASMLPALERISMPKRTAAWRATVKVAAMFSEEAARGMAVNFDWELERWSIRN